ncbi:TIGR03086 family metal-binding protein [Actinomadura parmotrematis]|uniref:TIGR03086 family protein n=1 Tax=Actinomadura parmotrematis TaxID=2864039 RepID=A0ABS7G146_9ACTN|nr:TIGR03086 family metal-binding protein [Actinomadura parmotrematis]MBW8486115.1 TIGR03086 family protein [Actinomadura parmotrematis]
MELREAMAPGAEYAAGIVRGVPADLMEAPTPCGDWDVRTLLNHLILWSGRGEDAARKRAPEGPGEEHDFTVGDGWADAFAAQALRTARAWDDAAAWDGDTSLTGASPGMPAAVIGGMVFGEWILHGWDLARATGQDAVPAPALVEVAYAGVLPIAEMARQYEAFGPEIAVPEDAPVLDRLLGATGRDPHWKP